MICFAVPVADALNVEEKKRRNAFPKEPLKSIINMITVKSNEFWQMPNEHLRGRGYPSCAGVKKTTTEEFIEEAQTIHGNKYDYSKTKYVNASTKVCVICPEHGEFWQVPHSHLQHHGCPECGKILRRGKRKEKVK